MNLDYPRHSGEFVQASYMEPFGLSCRYLARNLDVAVSTPGRITKNQAAPAQKWFFDFLNL